MVLDARSSRRTRLLGALLCLFTLPLWGLSQPLFVLGNGIGQLRRIVDAVCNFISSTVSLIADLFREEKRYCVRYPSVFDCLKVFAKNTLQLLPKLILLGAALIPGGQAIPAVAVFAKGLLAPVGHLLNAMMQPMVQGFSTIFSGMAAWISAASVTAVTVSVADQLFAGSVDKVQRMEWNHLFKRKISLSRRQSQPTSSQESSADGLLATPKMTPKSRPERAYSETTTNVVGRLLNQDYLGYPVRQATFGQSQSTQLEMTELNRRESLAIDESSLLQDYVYPTPPPLPPRMQEFSAVRRSPTPPPPPSEPHPDDLRDLQPPPPPSEPHPDELALQFKQ